MIPDGLRFRAPASAVITEALRVQSAAPPRSALQRLFGMSPLSADAQSWYLGALGELEVGRILDRLGDDWHTLHAVPVGSQGSDIDHVVIGPGGVFTINTKFHEDAKLWVGSSRLLVNGQKTDHLRNSEFEATRAAKILSGATGQTVAVTPILAIVAAKSIQIKEKPARVVVLRAGELVRRLERYPSILGPADIAAVMHVAVDPTTWSTVEPPAADLTTFTELREAVGSARRRRLLWATVGMLVVIGGLLAVAGAVFWR
ncbi:nuclease-related domain-containing protein [Microbacterium panaciterrae]|uniref:NERD domain-containing protein n=1 Tax=Microbacterium panaciterrae TaxID=985759 RepID=A0ABP8PLX2_9MICO